MFTILNVLDLVPFGQTGGNGRFFALRLENPGWRDWWPGQFVMLRPASFSLELPLGRPFSICHMTQKHLVCFFNVVGKGTELLAQVRRGDKIAAWGPLGTHFVVDTTGPTLLLAGGMGIAPFVGYVNRHPTPWTVNMLFGHRASVDCYPLDSINEHIPVDCLREQAAGDLDNLIFTMQEKIHDCAELNGLVLACGPLPFLRVAQKFSQQYNVRAQISLETRMACGIGACLGCVCRATGKWPELSRRGTPVQVCRNGPVFWADQVEI